MRVPLLQHALRLTVRFLCLLGAAGPIGALAQSSATPVPQRHVPASVLMDLRALESQFDLALARDCAPERCASKGCVYRDHVVVDLPRASSLPGLGQPEGPGSVPAQEYLTQAKCDFAHERSVATRDVEALVRRLEQRLSKGWLQVTVGRQILEPISPALSASPPLPADKPALPIVPPPQPPSPPVAPQKWEMEVATRELWLALLPHFSWMIALGLATLSALFIIWGLRRLGRDSLEEKALAAQLAAPPPEKAEGGSDEGPRSPMPGASTPAPAAAKPPTDPLDLAYAAEQQRVWAERIAKADLTRKDDLVVGLLRDWLRRGELDLLAKAVLLFGERLSTALASDGELAARKVELATHLRTLDEQRLPSSPEFFRSLNQHAIAASLLSQADTETYRSLTEEFGVEGLAQLIGALAPRHGALLYALAPSAVHAPLAEALAPAQRLQLAEQLLASNRISASEREYLFRTLDAARRGQPLPALPRPPGYEVVDHGLELGAPRALSALLGALEAADRRQLFFDARARAAGVFPQWYEEILYPDMLLKLPKEQQGDLLLEVDVKHLAGWLSVQGPAWREGFLGGLAPSLQGAIRASLGFASREEQLNAAELGALELVAALKRSFARGRVSLAALVE